MVMSSREEHYLWSLSLVLHGNAVWGMSLNLCSLLICKMAVILSVLETIPCVVPFLNPSPTHTHTHSHTQTHTEPSAALLVLLVWGDGCDTWLKPGQGNSLPWHFRFGIGKNLALSGLILNSRAQRRSYSPTIWFDKLRAMVSREKSDEIDVKIKQRWLLCIFILNFLF